MKTLEQHTQASKNNYRYPGVTPFRRGQADIFFGRERDTEALYRLMHEERLITLFGKSGLGKSSLLKAGIVPLCRQKEEYVPWEIRFNVCTGEDDQSPLAKIKEVLKNECQIDNSLHQLLPEEDSLWYYFKSIQGQQQPRRPLLLFDQFEELFTYPEIEIIAFQRELSELLHTEVPARVRLALQQADRSNWDGREKSLLESPIHARCILAIRSESVHLLNRLQEYLPEAWRNTYELKALTEEEARAAIVKPALVKGDFNTSPFEYSPEAVNKLLSYLKNAQDQRVDGILLQMLCESYERLFVEKLGLSKLEVLHIGEPDYVVRTYYNQKIKKFSSADQMLVRVLIEDGLVSEADEIRLSLHERRIEADYQVTKELLNQLVSSHLVRSEPFQRGGYTYELSHDRLVKPVLQARQKRLEEARLKEEQLIREEAERKAREEAVRKAWELEKTKKAARRLKALLLLAIGAIITAGYFAWVAHQQAEEALSARAMESEQREIAQTALEALKEQTEAKELAEAKVEFEILLNKSRDILRLGVCPQEDFEKMGELVKAYPEQSQMQETLQALLEDSKPLCR